MTLQGVPSIVPLSTAHLSPRKPAYSGTSRYGCRVEKHDKRYTGIRTKHTNLTKKNQLYFSDRYKFLTAVNLKIAALWNEKHHGKNTHTNLSILGKFLTCC